MDNISGREKLSINGLYRGEIINRDDPLKLGRCKVKVYQLFREIPESDLPWAWPCFMGAGNPNSGTFDIPPIGSTVWVMFEMGDPDHPVWMGGWWGAPNGNAETPEEMQSIPPDVKGWKTPSGHKIEFDDRDGSKGIRITDSAGNYIRIDTKNGVLEVFMNGDHTVTVTGDADISVNGAANVSIGAEANVTAGGPMQVRAPIIDLN